MEMVQEKVATMSSVATREAQEHNAQIAERYRKLQNAEAGQFAENTYTENRSAETVRASIIAPEAPVYAPVTNHTPVVEQAPQVTEYVRAQVAAPIFTADKFETIEKAVTQEIAPTFVAPTMSVEVAPVATTSIARQEQYALNTFAKVVMAVFTMIVVAMLTLICVNTHTINQKRIRLQNLEEKRQELVEQNEEIQRRIVEAKSDTAILEYAQSQGMVQIG